MQKELGTSADPALSLLWQHQDRSCTLPPPPPPLLVAHCVVNLHNCVKLAWDFYAPEHFGLYFAALRIAGGRYPGDELAAD